MDEGGYLNLKTDGLPALVVELVLDDLGALLLLDVDALLARNGLDLGDDDALALRLELGLALLLVLGLDHGVDDGLRHRSALTIRNVVALLLVLSFGHDLALLLRHLQILMKKINYDFYLMENPYTI